MELPIQPEADTIDEQLQKYIRKTIQDFAEDVLKKGENTFYSELYAYLAEQLEENFFKEEEEIYD